VFLTSHQLSGKGRGRNTWISAQGCLQFSLLLRHPYQGTASPIFIQYLAALAIVETVRCQPGYEDIPLRLKWPNDIYAEVEDEVEGKRNLLKLGGVLVNSQFSGDAFTLVVGCGVNCDNALPTISINKLVEIYAKNRGITLEKIPREKFLAWTLTWFQYYYDTFLREGGIHSLLPRYYKYWLHSNQVVMVEQGEGARVNVRIEGITENHGFLKTVVLDAGGQEKIPREECVLQPDGNSFDMMYGLIRRKQ